MKSELGSQNVNFFIFLAVSFILHHLTYLGSFIFFYSLLDLINRSRTDQEDKEIDDHLNNNRGVLDEPESSNSKKPSEMHPSLQEKIYTSLLTGEKKSLKIKDDKSSREFEFLNIFPAPSTKIAEILIFWVILYKRHLLHSIQEICS